MSVSVVLHSLPSDSDTWGAYIDHFRQVPGVVECRLTLTDAFEGDLSKIFSLADDFFKFAYVAEPLNDAQRLNQAAAAASGETLLLLERPYWVAGEYEDEWHELPSMRAVRSLPKRVSSSLHIVPEDELSYTLPVAEDALGSAFTVRRRHFLEMRGYDERDEFSDALGFDFLMRQRRSGLETEPLTPGVGPLAVSLEALEKVENEADIKHAVIQDLTLFRNLESWSVPAEQREPLISVAIATKDRGPMLIESINSVRYQSFQEFEIIVVDDGSADQAAVKRSVQDLGDPRIKFFEHTESRGVAAARNTAAQYSQCLFTAVHDDDDIMLPDRLLDGIKPLSSEVDATYGSWINFDHDTGGLRGFLTKTGFSENMIAFNGAGPGHSTWTVPTRLVQKFKYDERLTSSVDHELASRLMNAGVRWLHVEKFMYLRRVHDLQITAQDTDNQKAGHTLSKLANRFLTSSQGFESMAARGRELPYPKTPGSNALNSRYAGYLPDHLVTRDIVFSGNTVTKSRVPDAPHLVSTILTERDLLTGTAIVEEGTIEGVKFEDFVAFRQLGVGDFTVKSHLQSGAEKKLSKHDENLIPDESTIRSRVQGLVTNRIDKTVTHIQRTQETKLHFVLVFFEDGLKGSESDLFEGDLQVVRRIVGTGQFGFNTTAYLLGYSSLSLAINALDRLTERCESADVLLMDEDPHEFVPALRLEQVHAAVVDSKDDSGLGGE